MKSFRLALAACLAFMASLSVAVEGYAQKQGGVLRVYHRDSPASMSVHEEGTIGVIMPMMGVFNNLVLYDQNIAQNSQASIVPELATSWAWNPDYTALTFKLREGVKWHDDKPFTAADVMATWKVIMNPDFAAFNTLGWEKITDLQTPDDYTVVMKTAGPPPP